VCGAGALAIFWLAAKHTDLTALVGGGTLSQAGWQALGLYGLFIALLFGCIAAIGRRSKPLTLLQTPVQKRKLSHRTRLAAALILLCIPATLYLGFFYLGNTAYYPIAFAVLLECMVPFFLVFEGRKPQARELVLVASLCALGVAGRAAFFMLPQFKPVLALTIISGVALGGETGFLVGAMTMLASNVLFSQGPWTPFQMFAMGIIGFLAGVLFRRGWLRRSRAALVRVRCHLRRAHLRRHHEPRLRPALCPHAGVEGHRRLLCHRLSHGLRPRRSHSILPAGAGGAHAGEAGPHQDQIRPSGISRRAGATSGFPLFFRRNPRLIDNLPDLLYNRSKHTEGRTAYACHPLQGLRQDL